MGPSDFDLNYQNQQIDSKIIASLERISQAFRVLLREEGKKSGLSPIQIQILIFLNYHSSEKRTVSYLAREFDLTKATISATIRVLEQKNYIKKHVNPADSRSATLHLTESGKEIALQTSHFTREFRNPVQNLSAADKERVLDSLFHIIRCLQREGVISVQRMCFSCVHYQLQASGRHFCTLLKQPLQTSDLRIDCPEYEISGSL